MKDKSPGFGFCIKNGIIVDHPDYCWKGLNQEQYRPVLINISYLVVKVADVHN